MEDRTRTSQHRLDIFLRPGPGDQKFEGQLPPEIRAELEEGPPPPTYRHRESAPAYLRPAPSSRLETVYTLPPTRPPETEEEIALAMEWLKKAVDAGFKDVAQIKKDDDLAALREREDFKKLLTDLEAREAKGQH